MKDAIQEFIKSIELVIILLGVILILIAATDNIKIGSTFSSQITNDYWKLVIAAVGIVLVSSSLYKFIRESAGVREVTSNNSTTKVTVNEPIQHSLRSTRGEPDEQVEISFLNLSEQTLECIWINYEGVEDQKIRRKLDSNQSHLQQTYVTHPWLIRNVSTNEQLLVVVARGNKQAIAIEISDA